MKRTTKRLVRAGVVLASALSAVGLGAAALDAYGRTRGVPAGRWDAIVVLGCRVMPGGTPSPALARRARMAARLFREGLAPKLVLTGGVGDAPPAEAVVQARIARAEGVPESAMVLEDRSTTTEENARFAAALVPDVRRVVIVTDAYHVLRAERVFRRHFAEVRGVGTIADPWPRTKGALREVFALALDYVR